MQLRRLCSGEVAEDGRRKMGIIVSDGLAIIQELRNVCKINEGEQQSPGRMSRTTKEEEEKWYFY